MSGAKVDEAGTNNLLPGDRSEKHKTLYKLDCCDIMWGLLALGGYFLLSIFAFHYWFDDWPVLDCIYFCVITLTTIGFGDLTFNKTNESLVFAIFFCTIGVGLFAWVVSLLTIFWEEHFREANRRRTAMWETLLGSNKHMDEEQQKEVMNVRLAEAGWKECMRAFLWAFLPVFLVILIGGIGYGWVEEDASQQHWNRYIKSFYFAMSTCTTIGYGDVSPRTDNGKIFTILYAPIAVFSVGNALHRVAKWYVLKETMKRNKILLERDMTLDLLENMDADQTKAVSEVEFFRYMLVNMEKVDKETLECIGAQFKRLDVDGSGTVDKSDIMNMKLEHQRTRNALLELPESTVEEEAVLHTGIHTEIP